MSFKKYKQKARKHVHKALSEPAMYKSPAGLFIPLSVRLHRNDETFGDTEEGYAEMRAAPYYIVFQIDELPNPERGGEVTLESGEKYYIEDTLPPDKPNIVCAASEMG